MKMKQISKSLALLALTVAILNSFSGCMLDLMNIPPSLSKVESYFERDKEDLYLITDYLIKCGANDLYIHEDSRTALMDLEEIKIRDESVIAAIKRLREKGYTGINKYENTIEFRLWEGIRDLSCGIAYLIEGDEIAIQYVTETEPLPEDGWFYYVTDYEEARIRRTEESLCESE